MSTNKKIETQKCPIVGSAMVCRVRNESIKIVNAFILRVKIWLVDLILNFPVNKFSIMPTESLLPGYYQYFWEVNVPCSRTQQGDPTSQIDALTTRTARLRVKMYFNVCVVLLFFCQAFLNIRSNIITQ